MSTHDECELVPLVAPRISAETAQAMHLSVAATVESVREHVASHSPDETDSIDLEILDTFCKFVLTLSETDDDRVCSNTLFDQRFRNVRDTMLRMCLRRAGIKVALEGMSRVVDNIHRLALKGSLDVAPLSMATHAIRDCYARHETAELMSTFDIVLHKIACVSDAYVHAAVFAGLCAELRAFQIFLSDHLRPPTDHVVAQHRLQYVSGILTAIHWHLNQVWLTYKPIREVTYELDPDLQWLYTVCDRIHVVQLHPDVAMIGVVTLQGSATMVSKYTADLTAAIHSRARHLD